MGPSVAANLERLHIESVGDLLLHLPSRYEDRSIVTPLGGAAPGDSVQVIGQITECRVMFGKRRSLAVTITDQTGYLSLRFFHFTRRQQDALSTGRWVLAYGDVRFSGRSLEIAHPQYQVFDQEPPPPPAELTPVYPTVKGISQNQLRKLTRQLLTLDWSETTGIPFVELLFLHKPPADTSLADVAIVQERIALDELTAFYLVMKHRTRERLSKAASPLPRGPSLGRVLLQQLGFSLTDAQRRVVTEILTDLEKPVPMLRLVQGDVGSGKTVVAAFAAIRAAEHGKQTAIMAPTEILAEQHYLSFSDWLAPLGIEVVLLTGGQTAKERAIKTAAIESGQALVAVGTHALFQTQVAFHDLALAIVDEQHRFGVHQRMALAAKAQQPHQLIMTATPIPRTLTMALYADMDLSVIDELPAGRQPIHTQLVADTQKDKLVEWVVDAVKSGQQCYWVCTLIEASDEIDATPAEEAFSDLSKQLPGVALLHGRMGPTEKADTMRRFKTGELHLLVATTVIEVGVDVPNATIMVIENPERLGLAQLHQLRGRVGRGAKSSRCFLLHKTKLSDTAQRRLQVMRDSQDGFYIAEQDLELRGPGEILGTRQTGEQDFKVADLTRHQHLIPEAVKQGDELIASDPERVAQLLRAWTPGSTDHLSA